MFRLFYQKLKNILVQDIEKHLHKLRDIVK